MARSLRTPSVLLLLALVGPAAAEDARPGIDFVDPRVLLLDQPETVRPYPTKLTLSARILGRYGAPDISIIRPDGRAERLDASRLTFQPPALEAQLSFGHGRGIYRVEISATLPGRITHSGARLRFFVGVGPDAPEAEPPPDDPAEEGLPGPYLEARLFDLVNGHRKRARLDPFVWSEPLGVVARAHAAACVKVGRLDHRVNNDGNLTDRVVEEFAWTKPTYATPPDRPSPGPGAVDYLTAALDARRSLDLVLYRWQRFAAFCVPMTSEGVTHAACGIVRAPGDILYVVFAYAQINREETRRALDVAYEVAVRGYKEADGAVARAGALRELGRWRTRAERTLARRALKDDEPEVAAAAWDTLLLLEEEGTRREIASRLDELEKRVERRSRTADVLSDLDVLMRTAGWPAALVRARELRAALEAQAQDAWQAAEALTEDAAAFRNALRALLRDYPGTAAAGRAEARLEGGG